MADGSPRVVLIAGAGYVGGLLAESLVRDGARVITARRQEENLVRSTEGGSGAPGSWHGIKGDLRDPRLLEQVLRVAPIVDRVVITLSPPRSAALQSRSGDEFGDAMRGSVRLARSLHAQRVIYTSSTGVYVERAGGWVDEKSTLAGGSGLKARASDGARESTDARRRGLIEAEEIVREARDMSSCLVRLAGIYGPGRNPLRRYLHPEKLPMRGEFWTNRVRVEDIVAALTLLMDRPDLEGVYNCSDDDPARAIDVARWVMEERGMKWPERIPFECDDSDDAAGDRAPMRVPRSNKRVRNTLLRSLGWVPRYPSFREGMKEFL
ncbi:MAG: NAD-dependent epimerase/dehydratase family protein [Candidatus Hydrogenedentota bacterium]